MACEKENAIWFVKVGSMVYGSMRHRSIFRLDPFPGTTTGPYENRSQELLSLVPALYPLGHGHGCSLFTAEIVLCLRLKFSGLVFNMKL